MATRPTLYLDTSFLAPYYLAETTSRSIEAFIKNAAGGSVAISEWTAVEFASLLARKQRMGELAASLIPQIMNRFDQDINYRYEVLTPQSTDYSLTRQLILHDPNLGLRGPDGLHLAIASRCKLTLYTLDKTLLKAAHALNIEADNAGIEV